VETEEFDVSKCDAGGSYQIKMNLPKNVTASAAQVTFFCEQQKSVSRDLTVTLHAINLCESCGADLSPVELKVTVTGLSGIVDVLSASDISAFVDLLGMKPGAHQVEPYVHLNKESEQIKLDYPTDRVKVVIIKETP
jgi:YbbR domain-containing protein